MPDLMWLFLIPFAASILLFIFPSQSGKWMKTLAFILSLLPLLVLFKGTSHWVGTNVDFPWLPMLGIQFHLAIDNLSLVFLWLTAILIPISILSVRVETLNHPHFFYGLVLLLETLLIGFFTARNLVVFTFFWEAMLLPLYFIINQWGGKYRQNAAIKFLIYLIAGSALMIAAVLFLYVAANTFDMDELVGKGALLNHGSWVGAIFFLAFAVKTPLFPFHAWLPDAYCQAPTSGSILLAGLLSKAGIYGFLRIGLEIFPELIRAWSPVLIGLAIAGVFYAGLAAWMQNDFKRLIAYSSLSHVNFILAGIFILHRTAESGAILQSFNHGVTIAGLFLVVGWLEQRLDSTTLGPVHGLAHFLPRLCWLTLLFVLSSVALPFTNNFIGEFMILFGLFVKNPWLAAFLTLTVILSVIYMLRLMQKVFFEEPSLYKEAWIDLRKEEGLIALPLVALILWIGIYPAPLLRLTEPAAETNKMMAHVEKHL